MNIDFEALVSKAREAERAQCVLELTRLGYWAAAYERAAKEVPYVELQWIADRIRVLKESA